MKRDRLCDEMPAFVAAFLLLVAMCVGVRCAVFYEADGEQLRLITEGVNAEAMSENDAISRMRAHAECSVKVPGFTVIVGVRQYNMELSVRFRACVRYSRTHGSACCVLSR